jgi:hypothetical protein
MNMRQLGFGLTALGFLFWGLAVDRLQARSVIGRGPVPVGSTNHKHVGDCWLRRPLS